MIGAKLLLQQHRAQFEAFTEFKTVNDLIYNEPTNVVALFKDYLIYDDINEFLKRRYSKPESKQRIPRLADFYTQTSAVVPNYFGLGSGESKLLFKNIHRKNRLMLEPNESNEGASAAAIDRTHKKQQKMERFFDTNFKQEVAEIKVLKDRHRNSLENLVDDFVQIPTE